MVRCCSESNADRATDSAHVADVASGAAQTGVSVASRSFAASVALLALRCYQAVLSPFMGGACRFEPSCSKYATTAIEEHGLFRGSGLALRRLARCHPFGGFGFDPVPPVGGPGRPVRH